MSTIRVSQAILVLALLLTSASAAFALQPPPGGPGGGPGAGRPEGPPDGGPPPRGGRPPRDGFGPGGGPPQGPGGRDPYGPPGPPPLSPLEESDEKLQTLFEEEVNVRLDCDRLAEEAFKDQTKVADLRAAVTRHFEIRHQIRQRKVELLEAELAALKDSLAKRQERKDLLVDDRVSELLGKPPGTDF